MCINHAGELTVPVEAIYWDPVFSFPDCFLYHWVDVGCVFIHSSSRRQVYAVTSVWENLVGENMTLYKQSWEVGSLGCPTFFANIVRGWLVACGQVRTAGEEERKRKQQLDLYTSLGIQCPCPTHWATTSTNGGVSYEGTCMETGFCLEYGSLKFFNLIGQLSYIVQFPL